MESSKPPGHISADFRLQIKISDFKNITFFAILANFRELFFQN